MLKFFVNRVTSVYFQCYLQLTKRSFIRVDNFSFHIILRKKKKKKERDVKEKESRNCLAKQRGVRVLETRDEKTVI